MTDVLRHQAPFSARECAGIAGTLHQQLMRLQSAVAAMDGDEADRLYDDIEAVSNVRRRLAIQATRIRRKAT